MKPYEAPQCKLEALWLLDRPRNNDLHLLFVRTEKKRLSVVALDVALAKEKGLEAAKLLGFAWIFSYFAHINPIGKSPMMRKSIMGNLEGMSA